MDYINYGSDEDSCIVEDVDLEECERRLETDLPPVNDLEFIAAMAADFEPHYANADAGVSMPGLMNPSNDMVESDPDSDSSDDESEVDPVATTTPSAANAAVESSSSDSSSDSEDDVITTKRGYQKAARQVTMLTEEEEEGGVSGPLRTKNEVDEPVDAVNPDLLTVEDTASLVCIGEVKYRIDHECVVVIQADYTSSPLNEGSLLCNVDGKVLGKIQEIFGPITTPFYTVRWKNPSTATTAAMDGKNAAQAGRNAKGSQKKKGKKGKVAAAEGGESGKDMVVEGVEGGTERHGDGTDSTEANAGMVVEGQETARESDNSAAEKAVEVVAEAEGSVSADKQALPPSTSTTSTTSTAPPVGSAALAISDVRALFPVGAKLFSAPAHCTYVLPGQLKQQKGSDASNCYDEEPGEEEVEYSDDEQEMLAKQARKQALRAAAGGGGRGGSGGSGGGAAGQEVGDRIPTGYARYDGRGSGGSGGRSGRGAGRGAGGRSNHSGHSGAGGSGGYGRGAYGGSGSGSAAAMPMFGQPSMPMMGMQMFPGSSTGQPMQPAGWQPPLPPQPQPVNMQVAHGMGVPPLPSQPFAMASAGAAYPGMGFGMPQTQHQPMPFYNAYQQTPYTMPQQAQYYPMQVQQQQQLQGHFTQMGAQAPAPPPLPRYNPQPLQFNPQVSGWPGQQPQGPGQGGR